MDTEEKIPLMIVSTVCICMLIGAVTIAANVFMNGYEPATIEYIHTNEECEECDETCED